MGETPEQIKLEITNKKEPLEKAVKEKDKKDVENFINDLKNIPDPKKLEDISEVFDDYGKDIISSIKENFEKKEKMNEEDTNTLSEAIKAFETDIRKLNPDSKNNKLNKISNEIEKLKSSTLIKNNKIIFNLGRNRTPGMLESEFFKGGSESDFNDTFDYLLNMGISTEIFSTEDGKKFENMIKTYLGPKAESINIKKTDKTDPDYPEGTRIITYTEGGQEKKLTRGNREKEQERKSDKFAENIPDEIFGENDKGLNTFDGNGNHEAFKKFLEKKGTTYITSNLDNIINGIKNYKTEQPGNITEIKNGYANVLNEYISKGDEGLMRSYLEKITISNLLILGLDKKVQTDNFNKIVESKTFKRIQESLDKNILENLSNVKLTIETGKETSLEEAAQNIKELGKTSFDKIVKAFGGAILRFVELFGGKGLLKKFCTRFNIDYDTYFGEIEKLYNDKYSLSPEQLVTLGGINEKAETDKRRDGKDTILDRKGKPIEYNKENIKQTYIDAFSRNDKDSLEKFKQLDPALIQKALVATNIEQKDNIVIAKESSDGKTVLEINPDIEALTTDSQREDILEKIMTDDVREEVQEAGDKISRSNRVYNSALKQNEGMDDYEIDKLNKDNAKAEEMKKAKGLETASDIGLYLGVYLMKGSGDLKYSISQTDGLPISEKKEKDQPKTQ